MGDEARSDVALAIAALVFGPILLGGLRGGSGTGGVLVDVAVVLALTALVPLLLIRSRAGRGAGPAAALRALGLTAPPRTIVAGLPVAVPVAAAGTVAMLTAGAAPAAALLGRLSGAPLQLLQVAGLTVGSGVLAVFLVRRGAEAFPRSPEWTLRRLLRTFGMGAASVALVSGLLRVPLGADPVRALTNATALAAVVLLADRLLDPRGVAPRLAVLLPAGLVLYLHVSSLGFAIGSQAGALAAGVVVVIGTLALSARRTWTTIPLLLAVHLWPTCLTPFPFVGGLC